MRSEDNLEPQFLHHVAMAVKSVCDERWIFAKVLQVEKQEFSENNLIKWIEHKHDAGAVRNFPASRIRREEIDVGVLGLTEVVTRGLDQWIGEIDPDYFLELEIFGRVQTLLTLAAAHVHEILELNPGTHGLLKQAFEQEFRVGVKVIGVCQ